MIFCLSSSALFQLISKSTSKTLTLQLQISLHFVQIEGPRFVNSVDKFNFASSTFILSIRNHSAEDSLFLLSVLNCSGAVVVMEVFHPEEKLVSFEFRPS